MPRIRYAPRPRSSRRAPSRFRYKPPTPRADLRKYNVARKAGYKPKSRRPGKARFKPRADLGRYNVARRVGYTPLTRAQKLAGERKRIGEQLQSEMEISRLGTYDPATGVPYSADGKFTGHREAQRPITPRGGRVRYVDPALMERVMSSPPTDSSGAFEQQDFYQGEDFVNYLYEQGIVPHWGSPEAPSGRWVDYLLGKMGITGYGVNPFARPQQPQQPAQPAGYGGGGPPAYPAGGGYTPPKPKQYGGTRDVQGRNPPQWLLDMVVWTI